MTVLHQDQDPMPESIRGIKVIDVDTHLTEPADLWTSRAPRAYKDPVPRVQLVKDREFGYGIRKATNTTVRLRPAPRAQPEHHLRSTVGPGPTR
jgi:hypothetical protein